MEYEDFVTQFRAQAAARMAEFEKALARTKKDLPAMKNPGEASTKTATPTPGVVVGKHTTQVTQPPMKPVQPARGRARGQGPVQSILRKA